MFTGIVEELGEIIGIDRQGISGSIRIRANKVLEGTKVGDSIAVNGICLTVTAMQEGQFTADVMAETIRRSSLAQASTGDKVNLERAMAANGRFGGHMVAGHVDATGEIVKIKKDDNAVWFTIKAPQNIMKYCIEKGSIALDGISLTIADITSSTISVSMIPHTIGNTNFGQKKPGDVVNLENDMVGKYIDKLLHFEEPKTKENTSGITMEMLRNAGF